MIKAIQTRYAGCHFRSRLEARWAVFFDQLEIEWQYEPQGFELPSGPYLPDFYLPRGTVPFDPWGHSARPGADEHNHLKKPAWLEVKGSHPDSAETKLARELVNESGFHLYALWGDIPRKKHCSTMLGTPTLMMQHLSPKHQDDSWNPVDFVISTKLQAALDAARSARFEHGISGVS